VIATLVKSPSSPTFGQGFPIGFTVNGFEAPPLTLRTGKIYNFTVVSDCQHPFYLSTGARGAGFAPILEGWVDEFGDKADPPTGLNGTNQICGGASILWEVQTSQIGQLVTYQCFVHDNMGFTVTVQVESICDANVDRLSNSVLNSAGLVGNIINNLLVNLTSTAKQNLLIDYFDGTIGQPLNLTDKKTNGAALAGVQQGFVSFFGALLGCSDGSIPPYTGPSMAEVHAQMPIGSTEYGAFVGAFQAALQFLTFNQSDIDAVTTLLNSASVKAGVCNFEADCLVSLCNTYSTQDSDGNIAPGANEALVKKIVDNLFALIGADQTLLPFFNGTNPPGSSNIVTNAAALQDLKNRFVAFFGLPVVLACSDPNFPLNATSVQSLSDLQAIHQNIPIDQEAFNEFLTVTTQALTQAGFSAADAQTVNGIFNSTVTFVCNQPGCLGNNAQAGAEVFVLGVALKQSTNIWATIGFPSGYTLNGLFNQGLILVAGQQYVFQGNTSCFHPFYLTTGFGAGSTEVRVCACVRVYGRAHRFYLRSLRVSFRVLARTLAWASRRSSSRQWTRLVSRSSIRCVGGGRLCVCVCVCADVSMCA
jgi:truncated hemoglobin YjbI